MAFIFALLVLITAGTVVGVEMAKEGSGDYRSGTSSTFVVLPMEKERLQMNFEAIGVVVSAPENSPLHNASFRNIGTLHAIKGKWKGSGFVEWTRPNGDKVYATSEGEGVLGGGPSKSVDEVGNMREFQHVATVTTSTTPSSTSVKQSAK
jgi:hypothetical protein